MNALIQVTTNEQGSKAVSARELHGFLQVKSKFADWIKNRIVRYEFKEDQDFTTLSKNLENGGQEIDYVLTLGMAKELSMVERNDQGKLARQYFIDCERIAQQSVLATSAPAQLSRKELAMMVIQIEEEKEALQRQLEVAQPKVEYVDTVLNTDDCVVTTVIATELGYSAVTFNKLLRDQGIQWKVDGVWVLTSKYAGKGYTQMRTHTYNDQYGKLHTTMAMVWTQRGRAMLHYLFKRKTEVAVVVH